MKVLKGDLIKLAENGYFGVIVHGCNCFTTMGAGIARQLKEKYPIVYSVDCNTKKGDRNKLGSLTYARIKESNKQFIVVNAYIQYEYGNKMDCDYDAIRTVFKQIAISFNNFKIGYPKIGCGLAGGDWGIVSKIIDKELEGLDHTLVEYDPNL